MAVLDDDFSADATLTEDGAGIWSPPKSTLAGTPQDFQSLYEQQRARAEAAEARCEELRWAEVAARSDAGSWKSRFRSCRRRLSEANEEAKELRRAAKAAPSLRAAVARLETLLSEDGMASDETGAVSVLGKEVLRVREVLTEPEAVKDIVGWHPGETSRDRASREETARLKVTIRTLRKDITRLNREVGRGNKAIGEFHKKLDQEKERTESIRETAKKLSRENLSLHREARILGDAEAQARSLSDEVFWLHLALDVAKAGNKKVTARIAKLRAAGATLSKLPFDEAAYLRNVLRRSRRQKATIRRLQKENAWLRRAVKVARAGRAASEARLAKLRNVRKTLSASLTREGRLWNEFVARYHYLGYKTLVSAQMRYAVHDRNGWPVAMLGFSTAAWRLAPRDRFIGWTPEKREKNLPLVVDNPRFLILPWIEILRGSRPSINNSPKPIVAAPASSYTRIGSARNMVPKEIFCIQRHYCAITREFRS